MTRPGRDPAARAPAARRQAARIRLACLLVAGAAASGCAAPAHTIDRLAARQAFTREVRTGDGFSHVIYRNRAPAADGPLHVYIEGDGTPYFDRLTIAPDPTPRNPLMLKLMAIDPMPAVYIGRPCYFGLGASPGCSPLNWTIGRFGEDVVRSMAAVADRLRLEAGARGLVLLGHSGGGALAVLLAQRLPDVTAVVTLGGNLDPAAWAELHGYAPLSRSLNPSAAPLPAGVAALHVVGADDRVTPPALVRAAAERLGGGEVRVVQGARHTCCWEEIWPSVLAALPAGGGRASRP